MKKFAPRMTDGFGEDQKMAPEAHHEWADKEGKHNAIVPKNIGNTVKTPAKHVGADGFEPMSGPKQQSLKKHEGVTKNKGKEQAHSNTDSGPAAGIGHKTGPMTRAGKGKSGVVKGIAKANKKGVGGAGH